MPLRAASRREAFLRSGFFEPVSHEKVLARTASGGRAVLAALAADGARVDVRVGPGGGSDEPTTEPTTEPIARIGP